MENIQSQLKNIQNLLDQILANQQEIDKIVKTNNIKEKLLPYFEYYFFNHPDRHENWDFHSFDFGGAVYSWYDYEPNRDEYCTIPWDVLCWSLEEVEERRQKLEEQKSLLFLQKQKEIRDSRKKI